MDHSDFSLAFFIEVLSLFRVSEHHCVENSSSFQNPAQHLRSVSNLVFWSAQKFHSCFLISESVSSHYSECERDFSDKSQVSNHFYVLHSLSFQNLFRHSRFVSKLVFSSVTKCFSQVYSTVLYCFSITIFITSLLSHLLTKLKCHNQFRIFQFYSFKFHLDIQNLSVISLVFPL